VLATVLLVLFVSLGLVARAGPLTVDETLVGFLPRGAPPLPVRLANRLASAPVWTFAALIAAAAAWRWVSFRAALLILLADATAEVASLVSKLMVARQALDADAAVIDSGWWDSVNSTYLFPSAHVVRVTVLLGVVGVFLVARVPASRLPVLVASIALLVLLGYARVDVRAHLPTDVLGGYLLGGACLALTLMMATRCSHLIPETLEPRSQHRERELETKRDG
jgi:membrane-associated phospholipid phosphatase